MLNKIQELFTLCKNNSCDIFFDNYDINGILSCNKFLEIYREIICDVFSNHIFEKIIKMSDVLIKILMLYDNSLLSQDFIDLTYSLSMITKNIDNIKFILLYVMRNYPDHEFNTSKNYYEILEFLAINNYMDRDFEMEFFELVKKNSDNNRIIDNLEYLKLLINLDNVTQYGLYYFVYQHNYLDNFVMDNECVLKEILFTSIFDNDFFEHVVNNELFCNIVKDCGKKLIELAFINNNICTTEILLARYPEFSDHLENLQTRLPKVYDAAYISYCVSTLNYWKSNINCIMNMKIALKNNRLDIAKIIMSHNPELRHGLQNYSMETFDHDIRSIDKTISLKLKPYNELYPFGMIEYTIEIPDICSKIKSRNYHKKILQKKTKKIFLDDKTKIHFVKYVNNDKLHEYIKILREQMEMDKKYENNNVDKLYNIKKKLREALNTEFDEKNKYRGIKNILKNEEESGKKTINQEIYDWIDNDFPVDNMMSRPKSAKN